MTKKELQILVKNAVKESIKEELESIIRETIKKSIKKEFYLILEESEQTDKYVKDYSLTNMVKNESDPVREQIQERFFGGNDPISQVMNQTVKDVVNNKINMSNSTTHQQLSELNDRQQINRQSENNVMLQDNGGNDQGVPIDVIMGLNKNYKAILKKADKIANQMYRPNNPDKSVGSRASLQKFDKTVEDTYVNRYEKE